METEWILDWKMSFGITGLKNPVTGKVDLLRRDKPAYINLPGSMSTYESFDVAMSFANREIDPNLKFVLFAISIQNQSKYPGLRLNKSCLTAYPNETEVIIQESTSLFILRVEQVTLGSVDERWRHLTQDRPITIVYLCNMQ